MGTPKELILSNNTKAMQNIILAIRKAKSDEFTHIRNKLKDEFIYNCF